MNDNADREIVVRDLGERKLLELLSPLLPQDDLDVVLGIGDDCCITNTPTPPWNRQVTTIDMLVEGTHFLDSESVSWYNVGRKAIVSNVSDIAAMGGCPKYAVIGLAVPPSCRVSQLVELYKGMAVESREYAVSILGGDTVRVSEGAGVVISITLVGYCREDRTLPLRSNAKPGQQVFVTGTLGGSAAGLELLLKRCPISKQSDRDLIARHNLPKARVKAGEYIVTHCHDVAMIDISDSLFNEASLICEASNVGIVLNAESIPKYPGVEDLQTCLFSGEEYELLFTADVEKDVLLSGWDAMDIGCPLTHIGTVVAAPPSVCIVDEGNQPLYFENNTFRHF